MGVTVVPAEFHYVSYDADQIERLATEMLDAVGFPAEEELTIEVDEKTFFGRSYVVRAEPLHLRFESGAFEDAKRPRQFSDAGARESLGVVLLRALDRRGPGFAAAPPDDDLTLGQRVAWDTYAAGRVERFGWPVSKPRRQYHFRARHGFSDAADAAFEAIWTAESLAWAELEELTASLRQPAA